MPPRRLFHSYSILHFTVLDCFPYSKWAFPQNMEMPTFIFFKLHAALYDKQSTKIKSFLLTFVPNSVTTSPFTFTLPASIISSHFLLEAIPLLAKYFCNLISLLLSGDQ